MSVQVELTVTTGRTHLPVVKTTRYTGVVMATVAYTGTVVITPTVDLAFLTEAGDFLTAETGDLLLTA